MLMAMPTLTRLPLSNANADASADTMFVLTRARTPKKQHECGSFDEVCPAEEEEATPAAKPRAAPRPAARAKVPAAAASQPFRQQREALRVATCGIPMGSHVLPLGRDDDGLWLRNKARPWATLRWYKNYHPPETPQGCDLIILDRPCSHFWLWLPLDNSAAQISHHKTGG